MPTSKSSKTPHTDLGEMASSKWMQQITRALEIIPRFPSFEGMVSVRILQDKNVYDIQEFYVKTTILDSENLPAGAVALRLRSLEDQVVFEFLKNQPTPYVIFTERLPWLCKEYKYIPEYKDQGPAKTYFKICGIKAVPSLDVELEPVQATDRVNVRMRRPMRDFPAEDKRKVKQKDIDFRPPFTFTKGDDIALRMPKGFEQLFDIIRDKDGFPLVFVKQTETATEEIVKRINQPWADKVKGRESQ